MVRGRSIEPYDHYGNLRGSAMYTVGEERDHHTAEVASHSAPHTRPSLQASEGSPAKDKPKTKEEWERVHKKLFIPRKGRAKPQSSRPRSTAHVGTSTQAALKPVPATTGSPAHSEPAKSTPVPTVASSPVSHVPDPRPHAPSPTPFPSIADRATSSPIVRGGDPLPLEGTASLLGLHVKRRDLKSLAFIEWDRRKHKRPFDNAKVQELAEKALEWVVSEAEWASHEVSSEHYRSTKATVCPYVSELSPMGKRLATLWFASQAPGPADEYFAKSKASPAAIALEMLSLLVLGGERAVDATCKRDPKLQAAIDGAKLKFSVRTGQRDKTGKFMGAGNA